MIQLRHVYKTFFKGKSNEVNALQDVTMTIEKGQFVTITGPSGSGKSTMLHIIEGIDSPDQGDCVVDGINLAKASDFVRAKARNQKMGIVLQDFGLFNDLTVMQNLQIPVLVAGGKGKRVNERARELLSYLKIENLAQRKVQTLSGGQKQRAAIARGLMMNAELLLADEPTGALDHKATQQLIQLLQKLNEEEEKTIVVVTHDMEMASSGNQKFYMEDGKIFIS
jgi:putative ABC transport system ATP-binding protein